MLPGNKARTVCQQKYLSLSAAPGINCPSVFHESRGAASQNGMMQYKWAHTCPVCARTSILNSTCFQLHKNENCLSFPNALPESCQMDLLLQLKCRTVRGAGVGWLWGSGWEVRGQQSQMKQLIVQWDSSPEHKEWVSRRQPGRKVREQTSAIRQALCYHLNTHTHILRLTT